MLGKFEFNTLQLRIEGVLLKYILGMFPTHSDIPLEQAILGDANPFTDQVSDDDVDAVKLLGIVA